MKYQIRKNLLGRQIVHYDCPQCETRLTSPLSDAGTNDDCPDCGTQFTVPGTREKANAERLLREAQLEQKRREEQQKLIKQESNTAEIEAEKRKQREPPPPPNSDSETSHTSRPTDMVPCPYCAMLVHRGVKKCGHCGEWLTNSGHSDGMAFALGCLLGPVGLWNKGHWAAGFAWLFFGFITGIGTGGLGFLLLPLFWLGMAIHAASVTGRHDK